MRVRNSFWHHSVFLFRLLTYVTIPFPHYVFPTEVRDLLLPSQGMELRLR